MKKSTQNLLRTAAAAMLLLIFGILFSLTAKKPVKQDAVILSTPQMREAWLNLRGWKVDSPQTETIRIPQSWQTQAGQRWLSIQTEQGFTPEQYAGQEATQYRYPVLNAPNEWYIAELLLCGQTLIAADIYDASTQIMQKVR